MISSFFFFLVPNNLFDHCRDKIIYYWCFWEEIRAFVCVLLYKAPIMSLILLPLINITQLLMYPFYLYYHVLNPFNAQEACLITRKCVVCVFPACFQAFSYSRTNFIEDTLTGYFISYLIIQICLLINNTKKKKKHT